MNLYESTKSLSFLFVEIKNRSKYQLGITAK